jgi:hypothetical protein
MIGNDDRRVLKTALFYQEQFLALALNDISQDERKKDGILKVAFLHLLDAQKSIKNVSDILGR